MLITQAIFINTPLKVPILIFDLTALPCGLEGQVTGLAKVYGNTGVCKAQFIRPLNLNAGLANNFSTGFQAHSNFATGIGCRVK